MTLIEVEGLPGAPWERNLHGTLERLVVDSELLAGNPLGDPTRRPLYVYLPPGAEIASRRPLPSIYMLQGWGGQLDMWLARRPFEPTFIERLDGFFAATATPAVIVFVDAWTSLGGSQFLNSTSTGPYLDYLCDEVVPFVDARYPTAADRDHRGMSGHSSGGYGALVVPMLRPDVFAGFAAHAPDALFECCYQREFPVIARRLRDDFAGSYKVLFARLAAEPTFDWSRYGNAVSNYGYACAYSPHPDRPGEALLPFELSTGRTVESVWARWLEHDPVRMAEGHAEALRSLRHLHVEAGQQDEYFLDLGAQAFAGELSRLGIEHSLELFAGGHGGLSHRYPRAIGALATALA